MGQYKPDPLQFLPIRQGTNPHFLKKGSSILHLPGHKGLMKCGDFTFACLPPHCVRFHLSLPYFIFVFMFLFVLNYFHGPFSSYIKNLLHLLPCFKQIFKHTICLQHSVIVSINLKKPSNACSITNSHPISFLPFTLNVPEWFVLNVSILLLNYCQISLHFVFLLIPVLNLQLQ